MVDRAAAGSLRREAALGFAIGLAAVLLLVGLFGGLSAAWGYGLFLVACLLVGGGLAVLGVFALTDRFDGEALTATFMALFVLGAWSYVFALATFAGYFVHEAAAGRVGYKWIVFGPAVLAALIIVELGLYQRLVKKNLPTWRRYRSVISRQHGEPAAMRRTLMDEVILQRTLLSLSGFRWLRHTLIFWGFALMFAVELLAVVFREAVPAFGLPAVWDDQTHPLRLAFDFAFDVTGLMVLAGCLLALGWRVKVQGTELQKYTDTTTAVFLLFVVLSGFVVEGLRLDAGAPEAARLASFVGYGFAVVLPATGAHAAAAYDTLWLVHVLGSCAFIAYVPVRRLVHSCATPMGRLMNSQKRMLAAKKEASLSGLFPHKGPW